MEARNHHENGQVITNKNLLYTEDDEISDQIDIDEEVGNRQLSSCIYEKTCVYVHVGFFAIFGCLIRIALDHLTGGELANVENSESVVFKSFFSNMLGSFLLGLLVSSGIKKSGPLNSFYTGISTGLCGSITTYSKWNQQVSLLLIGESAPTGNSQVIAITAVVVGLMTFLGSLQSGKDSYVGHRKNPELESNNQPYKKLLNTHTHRKRIDKLIVVLFCIVYTALIITACTLADNNFVLTLCASALLAPMGASLRLFLAKFNGRYPKMFSHRILRLMPLGTISANLIGSTLIALSHVFLKRVSMGCVGVSLIRAFQGGFIACLTTVSTFMSEVSSLRETNILASYVYMTVTITLCQTFACLINGVNYVLLHNYLQSEYNSTVTQTDWNILLHGNC